MTTAAHEKNQYKKKVTNKQVDRLETIFGWMMLLEEISPGNNSLHQRKILSYLKVHRSCWIQGKIAFKRKRKTPTHMKKKNNRLPITTTTKN